MENLVTKLRSGGALATNNSTRFVNFARVMQCFQEQENQYLYFLYLERE